MTAVPYLDHSSPFRHFNQVNYLVFVPIKVTKSYLIRISVWYFSDPFDHNATALVYLVVMGENP